MVTDSSTIQNIAVVQERRIAKNEQEKSSEERRTGDPVQADYD